MSVVNKKLVGMYTQIHRNQRYGISSERYGEMLRLAMRELRPKVVLDYGCGQSRIHLDLKTPGTVFYRYDPAIPAISRLPVTSADLVINTDVMEHIPEADVDDVLADIRRISADALFVIATRGGPPLHCTVKPTDWWRERIAAHFDCAALLCDLPETGMRYCDLGAAVARLAKRRRSWFGTAKGGSSAVAYAAARLSCQAQKPTAKSAAKRRFAADAGQSAFGGAAASQIGN